MTQLDKIPKEILCLKENSSSSYIPDSVVDLTIPGANYDG